MRSFTAWAAAAALLALTGATHAADLGGGYPSYKDETTPYVRQFNWSGAYVGAQLGYAWSDVDARDLDASVPNTDRYGYDVDGVIGGGYLGFNWQTQGVVLGLEADVEYTDLSDSGRGRNFGGLHRTDVDWMGSVRGRLGFVADRALFYVTGGWAFADVDTRNSALGISYSDIRHGWTLGAGTEYAFSDNLIGRLEYRYSDFGDDSRRIGNGDRDVSDLDMHALRAGLAFKF